ncbi:MAG TPA: hypothetical protein VFG89_09405 [Coriobacteriia bacterium]|nr:hypothetical protein [Coriobacteriia bacterium]
MVVPKHVAHRAALLLVLACAFALCVTSTALAAPADPTMSVAQLRAALAASPTGTLTGHFKTVLKGYTISKVDATVVGVVTDSPTSTLILFTSTGDAVAGGIASGMSGSPLYVDDGGTDKMVGAVAYAGDFALNGAGLATPIDDMIAVENAPLGMASTLKNPVIAGRSIVDRVILTDEPERYAGEAAAGAMVAHPLSEAFIGGVKPGSGAYKLLSAALKRAGLTPTAMASGGSYSASSLPPQTLDPGASIGALIATGDAWMGGIGTETYRNGNNVMAFGHPLFNMEPESMFLTDAWVDGSWQSSWSSFKFASPSSEPRGAFVKDRLAGCMAVVGQDIPVTPVTAHAVRLSGSGATIEQTSTAVSFSRPMFNSSLGYAYSAAGAVALAGYRLYPGYYVPGSAATTTTVVVSDGTKTHKIEVTNLVDAGDDITVAVSGDVANAIDELMTVYDAGLYSDKLNIQSVNLEVAFSPKRRLATISEVDAPNGLRIGDNLIRIKLLQYGVVEPVVVEKILTLPEGTPLTGRLTATCVTQLSDSAAVSDIVAMVSGVPEGSSTPQDDRRTIAEIVDDVNSAASYNDLLLSFGAPDMGSEEGDGAASGSSADTITVESTITTGVYLRGSATKSGTSMSLTAAQGTVGYGGDAVVSGTLAGVEPSATVQIYAKSAGGTERLVEEVKTSYGAESENPGFTAYIPGLRRNTTVRAVYKGTKTAVYAEDSVTVRVKAKPSVKVSDRWLKKGDKTKLTAKVYPAGTVGSKVVFEYYSKRHHGWRKIATRTLVAKGNHAEAVKTWKIKKKGRWQVRVRTLAGATNAAGKSKTVTIFVR